MRHHKSRYTICFKCGPYFEDVTKQELMTGGARVTRHNTWGRGAEERGGGGHPTCFYFSLG